MTDRELLNEYVASRSPAAFAELVRRHISLVYSVARRHVRDAHRAEDVCQNIFVLLAQKAGDIGEGISLAAWLHRAAHFSALSNLRDRARQEHHEREAAMNAIPPSPPSGDSEWPMVAAEIDGAVEELETPQRDAVVLRFFAGKTYAEIGAELSLSEDGARKRVDRALELLREILTRRGLAISAGVLATVLLENATEAAPAMLAAPVVNAALPGKAAGLSAATVKLVLAAVAVILLIIGVMAAPPWHAPLSSPGVAAPAPTLITTAPASPRYSGWVHITDERDASAGHISHVDTGTGARVNVQNSATETSIYYENPKTGEVYDYHASTRLIRRGLLHAERPEELVEEAAALPIHFDAAVQPLRRLLRQEPAGITHATDQGLDRYDFTEPIAAARKILLEDPDIGPMSVEGALGGIPTTLWIDPTSDLTQRAVINGALVHYSYGGPDIASIYDAGAPRGADVYDNRPTPETLAVLDRARKRWMKPMPDGVSVILEESATFAAMRVHEQSKDHWIERSYTVRSPSPDGFTIDLPSDWANSDADEFFRRLAVTASRHEESGTESDVRFQDFTPYTAAETQPRKYQDGSISTVITRDHYIGRSAQGATRVSSPTYRLFFFRGLSGQYGVDNHVALTASPGHPGLIGVHYELRRLIPDSVRAGFDFWLDPAEGDRPVQFTEESFEDPPPADAPKEAMISSTGRYRTITDFSNYVTLSDGRQYPEVAKTTNYEPGADGRERVVSTSQTTFHFFPNRKLPPLKMPDTSQPNRP